MTQLLHVLVIKQQMKSALGEGFSMSRTFRMATGLPKEKGYMVIKAAAPP